MILTYEGVDAVAAVIGGQGTDINMMYIEFQNGGLPAPTVVPDPEDGRGYYATLDSGLSDRDYLRVPLIGTPVLTSTDAAKYAGNRISYYASTAGKLVGSGGHAFSAAAQSVVFGVALVAAADADDSSQDVVVVRAYAPDDFTAKLKLVNEEVTIQLILDLNDTCFTSSPAP